VIFYRRDKVMKGFDNINFHGEFRNYQSRVLDNADNYLKDGKLNIVAPPGSGKTVLGLELIRRLGEPTIILSPTTAIKHQWGERFKEYFLDDKSSFDLLFSFDLHNVKLINSITYQALYTSVEKVSISDGDTDLSDIDLFATINKFGIKTICLDEAHHLKNEWQKALEKFITALKDKVNIISFTATPPYDAEGSEWERYINVCGEIDEEIFIPELVSHKNLCPHQDYIYFNFPTEAETQSFLRHKENAVKAVWEISRLAFIKDICEKVNSENDYETLLSAVNEYTALLVLFSHYGFDVNRKHVRELTGKKSLPDFNMTFAETALQFILDGNLADETHKGEIINILKKNSVYDKNRPTLVLTERLKRMLISSAGKLESIKQIVKSEIKNTGSSLRMLILTDFIKKETLSMVATEQNFNTLNIISIFETLRRENYGVNIGVLSGSIAILPETVDLSPIKYKREALGDTGYCYFYLPSSSHQLVAHAGSLFEKGEIQILIGTKSLLGEGWDSPVINSLIIASNVGSFVLSNQMRGRAIRTDKNNPEKTANIWHLATVEPDYIFKDKPLAQLTKYLSQDNQELVSCDFDILKRRFDTFMGPNYTTGDIVSGIERITAIKPPFDKKGIEKINNKMLSLSSYRQITNEKWNTLVNGKFFTVRAEAKIPTQKRVPPYVFVNMGVVLLEFLLLYAVFKSMLDVLISGNIAWGIGHIVVSIGITVMLYKSVRKFIILINPAESIKALGSAVYKTLVDCVFISPSAKVEVESDKKQYVVSMQLRNASVHDQNIFNTAITEMLSPIDNPKYILIKKSIFGRYNYRLSFACPSIIAKRKEYAGILAKNLRFPNGRFEVVNVHRENGRRFILKCRKKSYISLNQRLIEKRYKVTESYSNI
jgi:superfamily II DNA or RNA helicase